jgi:hypothetical protein
LTLLSFVASQLAIKKQLIYAKKYYLDKKDKYLTRTNDLARLTDILNYSSCAVFICAIVFTIVFVSSNIGGEGMTAKKSAGSESGRGQAIPTMQKVFTGESKKGATIPDLQPVPPSPPAQQGNQGGGTGSSQSDKK